MIYIIFYLSAFLTTYFGVEIFRRWSIRKKILDIPNDRSSHEVPVPRGGGLIIALVCLASYTIYQIIFSTEFGWAYLLGATIIVLISWLDDIFSISIIWRFLCHIIAASLIIFQNGFWSKFYVPLWGEINFGLIGILITVLWIVWLINAYNFMDGIDGIAGIQAVTASIGWSFVGWFYGIDFYNFFGLIILFSSIGFLFHNWQPAKIFMGDVGSAFYGYTFAVFPFLTSINSDKLEITKLLPLFAIMFVWLFVFDSVFTIIKRIFKKEKVWKAHRQHLYQQLVIKKHSHSFVTIIYGILSILSVASVVFGLILYKKDIILITLIVIVTFVLIFLVYSKKMLTKEV